MEQGKLPGLQIARAFAALGIAYFHSWHVTMPFPAGTAYPIPILMELGWVSVDFFFAISGFVICLIATSDRFKPFSFMVKRAFRLYPLWIATSFAYLYLCDHYLGRSAEQTTGFFLYSLTLLPTDGFPFYDLGWSLQHEILFYLLASIVAPLFGVYGLAAVLAIGLTIDHAFDLPKIVHQYLFYYGNFLAGVVAFIVYPRVKLGFFIPLVLGIVAFRWAPNRTFFPIGLLFFLLACISLNATSRLGRLGALLGDASYSIYLFHPLVFYSIYARLQPPLPPNWVQEPLRYASLIVICALSIASWKLFEQPINRFAAGLTNSRRPISAFAQDSSKESA